MKESVSQFIQRMKEDSIFAQQVTQETSRENLVAIAREQGVSLDVADIDTINEFIKQERLKGINTETPAGRLIHKMMADPVFAEKIITQQDLEEVIQLAAEEGIVLTSADVEEANGMLQQVSGASAKVENGELSEEDLEQVAGGIALSSASMVTASTLGVTVMVTLMASAVITIFSVASVLETAKQNKG